MRGRWIAAVALVSCGRTIVPIGGGTADTPCGEADDDFFAQVVLGYEPTAGGGARPGREDAAEPETALGPPDAMSTPPLGAVSIGEGGTLTLGFEPCLMGSDGAAAPDLVVHEHGFEEHTEIELRPISAVRSQFGDMVGPDGFVRLDLRARRTGAVDIDARLTAIPVAARVFDAVRLRDVVGQGEHTTDTLGADVDAVEILVVLPGP